MSEPVLPLRLQDPHLSSLAISEHSQLEKFLEVLVTECCLPLLLGGAQKAGQAAFVAAGIFDLMEHDLEANLTDNTVAVLFDVQSSLRAWRALLSSNWHDYSAAQDDLYVLKQPPSGHACVQHFLLAVRDTDWYAMRLKAASDALCCLSLHDEHITDLRRFLEEPVACTDAYLVSLSAKLRYLPALQQELPELIMTELADPLASRVEDVWTASQDALRGVNGADLCQSMQVMLSDACICYSSNTRFAEMQRDLGNVLVQVSGSAKVASMVEGLEKMEQDYAGSGAHDLDALSGILQVCRNASGCKMSADEQKRSERVFQFILNDVMSKLSEHDEKAVTVLLDIASCVVSWLEDDTDGEQHLKLILLGICAKLHNSISKFESGGPTIEQQIEDEDSWQMLGEIQRLMGQASKASSCGGFGNEVLTRLEDRGSALAGRAKDHLWALAQQKLSQTTELALKYAGGMADGSAWDAGLGEQAGWEAVVARANTTILDKNRNPEDVAALDASRSALSQAGHWEGGSLRCWWNEVCSAAQVEMSEKFLSQEHRTWPQSIKLVGIRPGELLECVLVCSCD